MRYLLIILGLLMAGCKTLRNEAAGISCAGDKGFFHAVIVGGSAETDAYKAYMEKGLKNGKITGEFLREAGKLLEPALTDSKADKNARELAQYDFMLNDQYAIALLAHEAFFREQMTEVDMNTALAFGRRLEAARRAAVTQFAGWMPEQEAWEQANGDWAGQGWTRLVNGGTIVAALPEVWMSRQGEPGRNLASEDIDKWREAKPEAFRFGHQDDGKTVKELWIMQSIEKPEVVEGARIYMNLHAFPGRCVAYVNGAEVASATEEGLHSFALPLDFNSSNQCFVTVYMPDGYEAVGAAAQHAPWPVWLSAGGARAEQ